MSIKVSRRLVLAVAGAVVSAVALAGAASADGPSGSSEDGANNVTCAGTALPNGTHVYAGTNGVETCNQDPAAAANGRVIVSIEGGYVTADGANDNTGTSYGFVRVGGGSDPVSCGSEDPSNPAAGSEADNPDASDDNDATAGGGNFANCTD